MATNIYFFILVFIFSTLLPFPIAIANNKKTYIIHMNQHAKPDSFSTHHQWYHSLISSSNSIIYTYKTIFHGFAAFLDTEEVNSLKNLETVVLNIFENKVYSIQTTHTPQYLGLNSNFNIQEGGEFREVEQASEGIIVGVLDTRVWPESKSFDDTGLSPIPKRWTGKCKSTEDFDHKLCNKKLIDARYYLRGRKKIGKKDRQSASDYNGHGTHTASIVGGSLVTNASMFGFARGTARGIAVQARIACYKVCGDDGGCNAADFLKGMEQAAIDGIGIMSLSLGAPAVPYNEDLVAIGSFLATRLGILVSTAAGNNGERKAIANVAPWMLTVAAGSVDRDFPALAVLGNKQRFSSVSLYSKPVFGSKPLGLIYNKGKNNLSNYCMEGTLEPELVRGKVVVCDVYDEGQAAVEMIVQRAGGAAMIMVRDDVAVKVLDSGIDMAPGMAVGKKDGDLIKDYIGSVANPTVTIEFGRTVVGVKPAPVVAWFSSRGPNPVSPEILKPNIMAPGVNIWAAYSEAWFPTRLEGDKRTSKYVILSGTSMACPHVSGVAALLKAANPSWSPSAIKSALMTSASTLDNTASPITDEVTARSSNPWAYGSGHIAPQKAFSPGLINDISNQDYITFSCSLNYPLSVIRAFANDPNVKCSSKFSDLGELNYPSFSVLFANKTTAKYARELTNVGAAGLTYKVVVTVPPTLTVTVRPPVLVFENVGDKRKYTITFAAKKHVKPSSEAEFGSIVWSNKMYQVRSPIAITWS